MGEKRKLLNRLYLQRSIDTFSNDSSSDTDDEDQIMEFAMMFSLTLASRRTCHLNVPKLIFLSKTGLTNFDDHRMRQMLRCSKDEFDYILGLIKDDAVFQNKNNVPQLPVELQLKIALFRLGSHEDSSSIRKVAAIFGVGDGGTVLKTTQRVFRAIINLKSKFLFWPSVEERKAITAATMTELPGCVAYLDGTEIRLAQAPVENRELFCSRQKQYAIKIQIVCDNKLRIRQATIGHHGSVHESKIFALSSLGIAPQSFLSENEFIAADSAYPLSQHIITPFRQNSNELSKEIRDKFNEYFLTYRARVENCIGKLKATFGSLKEIRFRLHNEQSHLHASEWILCCCILHNILIDYNDEEKINIDIEQPEYPPDLQSVPERRTALATYIFNNR